MRSNTQDFIASMDPPKRYLLDAQSLARCANFIFITYDLRRPTLLKNKRECMYVLYGFVRLIQFVLNKQYKSGHAIILD